MENDYTPLANYLVNAPKYYDFSTGVPQAAQAFYQQFKQSYLDKINERHQIAVSGLGTLMAEVKKINAKRDSLMYGDHLSKSKVKKSMGEELFQLLQNYPVPPNNENQYIKEITNTNQAAEELKAQSQEKVRQVIQSYQSAYNKETERVNQVIMQQLMDNKDELAVLMFVDIYKRDQFPDLHQQVAHALYAKYPEHPLVVERYKVETSPKNSTNIGSMAPDLAFPDPDGKIIKLSDLRGKVVLLDFWAAWCRPCRMENPNVVKAYHQYKDKGFDVYSVSLDRDKNAWLKAIQDDGLVWPSHVSDLKHWSSEAAAIYGVRSIPATFLIGKDGRIVAKNLRGDALVNALKQLLGE
ncbi:MAG TPA: TlpA family protein disulfide reductase [Bacteroidales bacterium]|jgi:peroxiredoxin|nr:TlpA family protein disulfide reductase [Bacteroidales bacterium]